jgi:hypothetical protein
MSVYIEHYAKQAVFYAGLAMRHKQDAKNKVFNGMYTQYDWEKYLEFEEVVMKYAAKLMRELEHENAVMLNLFKNGDLK